MAATSHSTLVNFIFELANKLRGPYKPAQYRRVMLPLIVLRRLDLVLEPTKAAVLAKHEELKSRKMSLELQHGALVKAAEQPFYNTSKYTFRSLLADPEHLAANLVAYIRGFSPVLQQIFERFEFEKEIPKLEETNRLFLILQDFTAKEVNLHPSVLPPWQMGYVFEELIRRFNEQANEEAGDHFTPREVIRLMAALTYTHDEDVTSGKAVSRTVYDPTCGTGGMLSVSEEYTREINKKINLELFGQDYNPESWAICCADMLIKNEPVSHIAFGDVLGDGKSFDGHPGERFHYMLANPPFGVKWEPQKKTVEDEYAKQGFGGRFGPGLPRINEGSLLFLLHMLSKMHPAPVFDKAGKNVGGDGSKIAVVFNGSPLFAGEPGPNESNIRRWVIENDWLDAIVALPDQLFYNTGINTYIWLVSNRKPAHRRGRVQLINATRHYVKMKKSQGNKRNEIGDGLEGRPDHIAEIVRLYDENKDGGTSRVPVDGKPKELVCSKIFDNRDFGYLRLTVERPLRLNFQPSPERLARVHEASEFRKLATSKKKHGSEAWKEEIAAGEAEQARILAALDKLDAKKLMHNRDTFSATLKTTCKGAGVKLSGPMLKAILTALGERDATADICLLPNGHPEPDAELRDTELVPLPPTAPLPLPLAYTKDADNADLLALVQPHLDAHFAREVLPHWPDAWPDYTKTKLGYEIPVSRHFYTYEPPRELTDIEADIKGLEGEILDMLKEVTV
ncbi:type I restriction-modification system subunit M [Hymenobacter lucidus]|uniref:site-specific DNA-methyltransferase (adenine-specific) n=1 Tax=Hymenobacter lucidus TaxID=2880930 RepID=A0ABS8ALP2_9BACT|nr:class I SAM-dependent DNA methyltransferase [Hymenobacter lucidus]MCB2407017.1 type I restriction-modification system subunit M [Hymenobacter lucidus]